MKQRKLQFQSRKLWHALMAFVFLGMTGFGNFAQALNPGDIAFVGYNSDNPDEVAVLALADIPNNEVIFFTDNGWQLPGMTFRANEGIVSWTSPGILAGQVFFPLATAVPVAGSLALSSSGDQVLAYQGTQANPLFLAAINVEGPGIWQATATSSNTSALPTGLTNGTNAVALFEADNGVYGCALTSGAPAALLAAINTNIAWNMSNGRIGDINPCAPYTVAQPACTQDLIISEYIEGSSLNKCIEIYNGTGAAVDLAAGGYGLNIYFNGNNSPGRTINFTGTVADGDVFVICHNQADPIFLAQADQQSADVLFNGDDALELFSGNGTVDIFGNIGVDPGSGWFDNGVFTQNQTLIRKATVNAGIATDPAGTTFPTLDAEWSEFPINFSGNLGTHSIVCGAPTAPVVNLGDDQVICPGGSVLLDAGNPGSNYLWSTGETTQFITVNASGTYAVGVANQAGLAADSVTIVVAASAVVTATATSELLCPGGNPGTSSSDISVDIQTGDLFISEYIEGSGNNKCIEIYNGTGAAIDLAAGQYGLVIVRNGGTSFSTIALMGTIQPGDVFVICNDQAAPNFLAEADQTTTSGVLNFNGDDAVVFGSAFGQNVLDVFGRVGDDPGSQWVIAGVETQNQTLRRKCDVFGGIPLNPTGTGPAGFFTLDDEWDEFPQNDAADLGQHTLCPNVSWNTGDMTASITVSPTHGTTYIADVTDAYGCSSQAAVYVAVNDDEVAISGADDALCAGDTATLCAEVQSMDLFISEYIEGSSFNKYIELYNNTGADIDLSNYELRLYSNGATSPTFNTPLSGTITAGGTVVLANPRANIYGGATQSVAAVNFNGDDAVELWNTATGQSVDVFGVIGQDPGSFWADGANVTQNATLRRMGSVTRGIEDSPFGDFNSLGSEWAVSGINDVSGLGSHMVSATGTYAWGGGEATQCISVAPMMTTTYDVTYTATDGCDATASAMLMVNPAPTAEICTDAATIAIGYEPTETVTIIATATGGTAPYMVMWSNGAMGDTLVLDVNDVPVGSSMTFTVTVTDANGCSSTDDVTVDAIDIRCASGSKGLGTGSKAKVLMCAKAGQPSEHTKCVKVKDVAKKLSKSKSGYTLGPCGTTVNDDCAEEDPCGPGKTTMCHKPNKPSAHTHCIDDNKIASKLKKSDWILGPCPNQKFSMGTEAMAMESGFFAAFPNPFNSTTTLRFSMQESANATLKVYDVTGVEVANLFTGEVEEEQVYEVEFSAQNLADGVYYAKLVTDNGEIQVTKLAVVR